MFSIYHNSSYLTEQCMAYLVARWEEPWYEHSIIGVSYFKTLLTYI
jgi:hypothetical protein